MIKQLHNCTHLTHQQSNAQNSPSQASALALSNRTDFLIANILWIIKKAREFQKDICLHFIDLTMPKPLTVWITINCGKF